MLQRFALAGAALLILSSCGGSDSTDEPTTRVSPGESSTTAPTEGTGDAGETVARERFCPELDPEEIGSILGIEGLETVVDTEPGERSPYWTCTIGQTTGSSLGVTLNLLDAEASSATVTSTLDNYASSLGPQSCADVGDEALGAGTRGVDCSGTSSGTGFTLVARAIAIGGTQIECLMASYSADDLTTLRAAAPEICALFRDLVVS